MPTALKEKALALLFSQTPRVLIVIVTIGALCGMSWFGKLTDVLAGCITFSGGLATIMNYKILQLKEGGS